MTTPKPDRRPAALTLPVPGDLGALLRDVGYDAELVLRRADGRDPQPSDAEAVPLLVAAVEAADASGRACGVDLRGELAARSFATGPANQPRTKAARTPVAGAARKPSTKSKPRGKRAAAKRPRG